ncbi:MAG: hypothetical protein ABIS36_10675 [Chryseolinea sp.]
MIKKIAGVILFSAITFVAICQETSEPAAAAAQPEPAKITAANPKTIRPDIPGILTFEFGFNRALSAPTEFKLAFLGSHTTNLYYQYEFRVLKSQFSIVPGIGFAFERFRFKNNDVIGYNLGSVNQVALLPPGNTAPYPNVRKSFLVTNYVDVPVEIRYTLKPEDPTRSVKIGVGGRIGYLLDSYGKVKYTENSEVKKIKDKQDFNLNKIRYGLSAHISFGNFSFFGYYNLSPLFQAGKGLQTNNVSNDFSTATVGISLSSF